MKNYFCPKAKQQGFTIVELSIVLIIAAILVSGAIGLSRFLDKQKARSNATDITTVIKQARAEAKKSGKPVYILVDSSQVRVLRANDQYISAAGFSEASSTNIAVVNVDPVVALSPSSNEAHYFTSYGVLAPSAEFSIAVNKKTGAKYYTVKIQANGDTLIE